MFVSAFDSGYFGPTEFGLLVEKAYLINAVKLLISSNFETTIRAVSLYGRAGRQPYCYVYNTNELGP